MNGHSWRHFDAFFFNRFPLVQRTQWKVVFFSVDTTMDCNADGLLLILAQEGVELPRELLEVASVSNLEVRRVWTVYEVATALHEQLDVKALFIEPTLLNAQVAKALQIFRREMEAPFVVLPSAGGVPARVSKQIGSLVSFWPDAHTLLAQLIHCKDKPLRRANGDESGFTTAEITPENVVTSAFESRYDELDAGPLLSEEEIRALLGALD